MGIRIKKTFLILFIFSFLLLSGCSYSLSPVVSEWNKNNISIRYEDPNYGEILKEEVERCPIPVLVVDRDFFIEDYLSKSPYFEEEKDYSRVVGLFIPKSHSHEYPKTFIFISDDLETVDIISVLFHEWGHHLCRKNKCICTYLDDQTLQEYHAYSYQMYFSLGTGCKDIVEATLDIIIGTAYHGNIGDSHTIASRYVISGNLLFDQCRAFLLQAE